MNAAYDALLVSTAWDDRYDLPAVPQHLNPHIYCAYAVRILESFEVIEGADGAAYNRAGAETIRQHYAKTFLVACEKEPGLLTTYPGGGVASHDDTHGAGFLNSTFAARCADYLDRHDGVYTDQEQLEKRNLYRFPFFIAALKAHAGFRVGAFTQAQFAVALAGNLLLTKKGETDGTLMLWLALPAMRKSSKLMAAAIDYWCARWTARGLTPKTIFKNHYLTECPWFGEWARDSWQ